MRGFKILSQEEKNQILEEKKKNPFKQAKEFAQQYQVSDTTISSLLRKNHCTTFELTGLKYRKYNVDDNYFEKIDTHEKAYLLGVWYSDGYLVTESTKTKRIGLDVKDSDWLIDIGKALKSEAPLYKTAKDNIKRLKVTSPKLYEDLKKLGCVEHKTFVLKFPTKEQVPREFIYSFILGIFDGDGCLVLATPRKPTRSFEVNLSFTGTKELLEGIQKVLGVQHLKLSQRFPERHNNNYTLQITGFQQVLKILKKLYQNAPNCVLKRKQNKFYQIINDSRAVSKETVLIPANSNDNEV